MTPLDVWFAFLAFICLCAIGDVVIRTVDPENRIADWVFRR